MVAGHKVLSIVGVRVILSALTHAGLTPTIERVLSLARFTMKKYLLITLGSLFLPFAALAQSTTIVEMPPGLPGDIASNAGAFFTSWEGFVVIIGGTLLGTLVIGILINMMHPK